MIIVFAISWPLVGLGIFFMMRQMWKEEFKDYEGYPNWTAPLLILLGPFSLITLMVSLRTFK